MANAKAVRALTLTGNTVIGLSAARIAVRDRLGRVKGMADRNVCCEKRMADAHCGGAAPAPAINRPAAHGARDGRSGGTPAWGAGRPEGRRTGNSAASQPCDPVQRGSRLPFLKALADTSLTATAANDHGVFGMRAGTSRARFAAASEARETEAGFGAQPEEKSGRYVAVGRRIVDVMDARLDREPGRHLGAIGRLDGDFGR